MYRLAEVSRETQGWDVILRSPTLHLLAHHASTLSDFSKADVIDDVRAAQTDHRGIAGIVTTTGGQTAILDLNAELLARHSRTLFAETDPERIQERMRELVVRRGVGPTFSARLVTYLAEAMENVREHGLHSAEGSIAGVCLLQIKRINLDQLPGIERQLSAEGRFRSFVVGLHQRYGHRLEGLLETSIADSGAGIAATLGGDPSIYVGDLDREREILLRAFDPTVTRKPTAGKGGGLTTMLENLHAEDGAIQVRCGRYSLFRTSVTPDGQRREWSLPAQSAPPRSPDPSLWDVRRLPLVAGTGITLLTPIVR